VILFYLRLEFAPDPSRTAEELARGWAVISPPLAAVRQLKAPPSVQDFSVPVVIAGAAMLRGLLARHSRQVIHNSRTSSE